MTDQVNMLLSISHKHSVLWAVGFIKGKSAIHLARAYGERRSNFVGQNFWARGHFVSTVGRDEEVNRLAEGHSILHLERLTGNSARITGVSLPAGLR